jgi:hypothetical protein
MYVKSLVGEDLSQKKTRVESSHNDQIFGLPPSSGQRSPHFFPHKSHTRVDGGHLFEACKTVNGEGLSQSLMSDQKQRGKGRAEDKQPTSPPPRTGSDSVRDSTHHHFPSPQRLHYPPPPPHMQVQHPHYHPRFPPPPRHAMGDYHRMEPHHPYPPHVPLAPRRRNHHVSPSTTAVTPESGALTSSEFISPSSSSKRRALTPGSDPSPSKRRRRPSSGKNTDFGCRLSCLAFPFRAPLSCLNSATLYLRIPSLSIILQLYLWKILFAVVLSDTHSL